MIALLGSTAMRYTSSNICFQDKSFLRGVVYVNIFGGVRGKETADLNDRLTRREKDSYSTVLPDGNKVRRAVK